MLLEDSQAVTTRRREEETASLDVTQDTLKKLQGVIVLQDEGIVYCPIPKVMEWITHTAQVTIYTICYRSYVYPV